MGIVIDLKKDMENRVIAVLDCAEFHKAKIADIVDFLFGHMHVVTRMRIIKEATKRLKSEPDFKVPVNR